jgi:hypothetical protein
MASLQICSSDQQKSDKEDSDQSTTATMSSSSGSNEVQRPRNTQKVDIMKCNDNRRWTSKHSLSRESNNHGQDGHVGLIRWNEEDPTVRVQHKTNAVPEEGTPSMPRRSRRSRRRSSGSSGSSTSRHSLPMAEIQAYIMAQPDEIKNKISVEAWLTIFGKSTIEPVDEEICEDDPSVPAEDEEAKAEQEADSSSVISDIIEFTNFAAGAAEEEEEHCNRAALRALETSEEAEEEQNREEQPRHTLATDPPPQIEDEGSSSVVSDITEYTGIDTATEEDYFARVASQAVGAIAEEEQSEEEICPTLAYCSDPFLAGVEDEDTSCSGIVSEITERTGIHTFVSDITECTDVVATTNQGFSAVMPNNEEETEHRSLGDLFPTLVVTDPFDRVEEEDACSVISDITQHTDVVTGIQSAGLSQDPNLLAQSERSCFSKAGLSVHHGERNETSGVKFGNVQVRYYERILDINPSVSSGVAVGIGWKYRPIGEISVDDWELYRDPVRKGMALAIPRHVRERTLKELGYTQKNIATATRVILRAKRNRRTTVHNLKMDRVAERAALRVKEIFSIGSRSNTSRSSP